MSRYTEAYFWLSTVLQFLRVLIFATFAIFPAIRNNKFPQLKI